MSKIQAGILSLAAWFEARRRILPWREEPSLYRVWVSEIMLQQTQVVTVVPFFERFMSRFPSVEKLAEAAEEEVLHAWAGLGYYSRARNLHKAARLIVERGDFPRDREGWLQIPGVGEYTAGAILSIALDQPEAILDGNVERVVSRVRQVSRARGDAAYKARLWRLSCAGVELAHQLGVRPNVFNQALMELGATVCTFRNPKCAECPVSAVCGARASGQPEAYPPKKKPKEWIAVEEELHCLWDGGDQVLVEKRGAGQWRAGLWDLLGEAPAQGRGKYLGVVESRHVVTRHKVTRKTHVWLAGTRPLLQASEPDGTSERRWVSMTEPEVALGSAIRKAFEEVKERFGEATVAR